MTARARFTKADLARVFKALKESGSTDWRVEIELDGKIVIFPGNAGAALRRGNSWDDILE